MPLLETAITMAEIESADVHVLHAWELFDERYLRRQGLRSDEMAQFVVKARGGVTRSAEPKLARVAFRLPPVVTRRLRSADPARRQPVVASRAGSPYSGDRNRGRRP